MLETKNIIEAKLSQITVRLVKNVNLDTGIETQSISLSARGHQIDEDGKAVKEVMKTYDMPLLDIDTYDKACEIFSAVSKLFNNDFADEDSETFITGEIN